MAALKEMASGLLAVTVHLCLGFSGPCCSLLSDALRLVVTEPLKGYSKGLGCPIP